MDVGSSPRARARVVRRRARRRPGVPAPARDRGRGPAAGLAHYAFLRRRGEPHRGARGARAARARTTTRASRRRRAGRARPRAAGAGARIARGPCGGRRGLRARGRAGTIRGSAGRPPLASPRAGVPLRSCRPRGPSDRPSSRAGAPMRELEAAGGPRGPAIPLLALAPGSRQAGPAPGPATSSRGRRPMAARGEMLASRPACASRGRGRSRLDAGLSRRRPPRGGRERPPSLRSSECPARCARRSRRCARLLSASPLRRRAGRAGP
jgi:hypothetical protein